MKRKIIKILCILAAAAAAIICGGFLGSFLLQKAIHRQITPKDYEYEIISEKNKTCRLTEYHGASHAELMIPEIIDGYTVVELGEHLFSGCVNLTGEIHIPETVTVIEEGAFFYCMRLEGVLELPEGLISIGDKAFYKCEGLTGIKGGEVTLPNGEKKTLVFPKTLTSIGDLAFCRCSGIVAELEFPEAITYIGEGAFHSCSGLYGSVVWPENIERIERITFYGCSGLNGSLTLPEGVTVIGDSAFEGCGLRGELILPEKVTIYKDAFVNCNFSGDLVLPATKWMWRESADSLEKFFDVDDFDTIIDRISEDDIQVVDAGVEIFLDIQQRYIKYDENTGCLCGVIEVSGYMDDDGNMEQVEPDKAISVIFKPVGIDSDQLIIVQGLYMEDDLYYFETDISRFESDGRYCICAASSEYYNMYGAVTSAENISEKVMFDVLNEKYDLPEGVIVNSDTVYIHYANPGILYIRRK